MPTVFANTRGVIHKGSGGMSTVFPDVCKTPTPAGPIPIPYPNIGKSADTSSGPDHGQDRRPDADDQGRELHDVHRRRGRARRGASSSGKFKGECEFMLYSFDVKFEGKNVVPAWRTRCSTTTRTSWAECQAATCYGGSAFDTQVNSLRSPQLEASRPQRA